jgi:hypothetical protein
MHHVVSHAVLGDSLWRSHEEALALWNRLLVLQPAALCLMPDHAHALTEHYDRVGFARILSGYARWRSHHRGEPGGRVWLEHPEPRRPSGSLHLRRSFRYIALNPCRDGLVDDPLSWVWSTHRDSVGLAWPPVVRPSRQPERLHGYVSSDPSVGVEGTSLPVCRSDAGKPTWRMLVAAASALTRTSPARLATPGPGRQVLVAAARQSGGFSLAQIASSLGVSRWTVQREPAPHPDVVALVTRICGDSRFPLLFDERLDRNRRWRRYMEGQSSRRSRKDWLFD